MANCFANGRKNIWPESWQLTVFWVLFFHWQIAHSFAVQDEFTQKTQDLNPECKEDSNPIMQWGIKLGACAFLVSKTLT